MSATTPDEAEGGASSTPRKKHRHDLGQEDHGPVYFLGTTRAIQGLLGVLIALTIVLVTYTLVQMTGRSAARPPAAPTSR